MRPLPPTRFQLMKITLNWIKQYVNLDWSPAELAERLGAHAEKEQGALVPLVDEMLDEATDLEIWAQYTS